MVLTLNEMILQDTWKGGSGEGRISGSSTFHRSRHTPCAELRSRSVRATMESVQSCVRTRLEVANVQLHTAKTVVFVEPRRENQAAVAFGGHQLLGPISLAKGDGMPPPGLLANSEAEMPFAAADLLGFAHHLQAAG